MKPIVSNAGAAGARSMMPCANSPARALPVMERAVVNIACQRLVKDPHAGEAVI